MNTMHTYGDFLYFFTHVDIFLQNVRNCVYFPNGMIKPNFYTNLSDNRHCNNTHRPCPRRRLQQPGCNNRRTT